MQPFFVAGIVACGILVFKLEIIFLLMLLYLGHLFPALSFFFEFTMYSCFLLVILAHLKNLAYAYRFVFQVDMNYCSNLSKHADKDANLDFLLFFSGMKWRGLMEVQAFREISKLKFKLTPLSACPDL